jgi:hypothetical protein
MKFESSIHVTNSTDRMLVFHLEPWGEQVEMPSGARFLITAEAEQQGSFELEHGENEIVVWGWPGAVAKVFCDGKEISVISGVERLAVPSVPEGQSVSSFLRSMLGKDGEV